MKAKPIEMFDPDFYAACKKKPKPKFKLGQKVKYKKYGDLEFSGIVVAIDMYTDFDGSYDFTYSVGGNGSRIDSYEKELSPVEETK